MSGPSHRARLLRGHPTLNGIDFIEIVNVAQTTLRVHFVNPVESLLGVVKSATIEGGDVIAEVPVLPISDADWSVASKTLTLQVASPGDFSNYTLRLLSAPSPNTKVLDPYFDHATFSFKAGCSSLFDCAPPEAPCPRPCVDAPLIDYLAKDFQSFRAALLELSAVRYPGWKERSEGDFGVMFAEALSSLADDLSYLQDRIAAEATLDTATERRSVVRHAHLVDYEPRPATAARVLLQFDVSSSGAIPAGWSVTAQAPDGATIPFETGTGLDDKTSYAVNWRWNRGKIKPYWWDDADRCLHTGATEMWVAGHGLELKARQRLLLDTAPLTAGDKPRRAQVTLAADGDQQLDPLTGEAVTRVVFRRADALAGDHDLTRTTLAGNLVPATQGCRLFEEFAIESATSSGQAVAITRTGPNATPQHLHALRSASLAWLSQEGDLEGPPSPEILVYQVKPAPARPWKWARTLLEATSFEGAFTLDRAQYRPVGARRAGGVTAVEYDGAEGDTIRFGDGTFGPIPDAQTVFQVKYRIGLGATGNVAANTITRIEPGGPLGLLATTVTNPFPASGGADAETDESVRRLAPQVFRSKPRRAVRKEDYESLAGELPWVQRAHTKFRHTGSWLAVFTTPDPRETWKLSTPHQLELIALCERVRLAGYASHVLAPRFVALDLQIEVCARQDAFQGDVQGAILDALSARRLRDGTLGFFHVDRFTFGQGLPRSALEAAVQRVPGVDGVRAITYRRRSLGGTFRPMPNVVGVAPGELLCVDADANRPERGSVTVTVMGGK